MQLCDVATWMVNRRDKVGVGIVKWTVEDLVAMALKPAAEAA